MPNLVLEYSNSVDERVNVQGLLEDLHQVVMECGLFDIPSIKSRALRCHHWLVGMKRTAWILFISVLRCWTGAPPSKNASCHAS